jgi:hypothetical protein
MRFTILVLLGLALMTCIGLLRTLKELIDAKSNPTDETWHDL